MQKKGYVPDVSLFFGNEKKLSVDDFLNLRIPEQETVTFNQDDLYIHTVNADSFKMKKSRRKMCFKNCRKRKNRRTYS